MKYKPKIQLTIEYLKKNYLKCFLNIVPYNSYIQMKKIVCTELFNLSLVTKIIINKNIKQFAIN